MRIGASKFDVALLAVGLGVLCLNVLLFIVYLVMRRFRDSQGSKKTDRPFWILLLVLSGSLWILGSLQSYGIAQLFPESRWTCACVKYGLQFTAGFVLWQSAIEYRMVRLFVVYTMMAKRQLHAVVVLLILIFPFTVLTAVAIGTSPPNHPLVGCYLDRRVLITLYSLLAALFTVFMFLLARLVAVMGVLKGMRRCILWTGVTFVFVPLDAVYTFRLGGNLVFKRVLMIITISAVAGQLWTVYSSLFIRTKPAKSVDNTLNDKHQAMILDEDANPLPSKLDLFVIQERARRRMRRRDKAKDTLMETMRRFTEMFTRTTGMQVEEEVEPDDEVDERVSHYRLPDDFIIYTEPATTGHSRPCRWNDLVDNLHQSDKDRIDKNEGVYSVANMYCQVTEDEVNTCLKYLGEPIDLIAPPVE